MASAVSAAVEAKIVMATCSLISTGALNGFNGLRRQNTPTEFTRIHESPEGRIFGLQPVMDVAGTWDDFFQDTPEDVGDNLDEQLTDKHRLRTEILPKTLGTPEYSTCICTHEDLAKDSAEASEAKTQEPHTKGKGREGRIILQRYETGGNVQVGY